MRFRLTGEGPDIAIPTRLIFEADSFGAALVAAKEVVSAGDRYRRITMELLEPLDDPARP